MNIEIANRLVKLRKQSGLSQEELADKLGISRQAVSKWERAEASPDTDNLICLAKLYGVSLDDLLNSDENIEDIARDKREQAQEEKKQEEKRSGIHIEDGGDSVHIDNTGIHITDSDGSRVDIGNHGVEVVDGKDHKVIRPKMTKRQLFLSILEGSLFLLAVIGYLLCGFLGHLWHCAWVLFFVPEIITSFIKAIMKRRFTKFNIAFAACFAFFFVCMWVPGLSANLWHIMWVVFLAIPLYYSVFGPIDRYFKENKKDDTVVKVDVEVKDDDEDKEENND